MDKRAASYKPSKMSDYEIIEQIGRGAFGAAYLVLHITENKKYVIYSVLILL